MKLDLGGGQNVREGFECVDKFAPDAKHKVDLFEFPWPFEDGSVEEINCSHFFEHVPNMRQKLVRVVDGINPEYYKLEDEYTRFKFMDECYRILRLGGKLFIICPYAQSHRAIQDATHQWPPIAEPSFLYFNEPWRIQNKLDHYPISCNFDFGYGFSINPQFQTRSQEFLQEAQRTWWNVVDDVQVALTKIPRVAKPEPVKETDKPELVGVAPI